MDYIVNDTALTATADAIREKTESTDKITWSGEKGFADAISEISGGTGTALTDAWQRMAYEIQEGTANIRLDLPTKNIRKAVLYINLYSSSGKPTIRLYGDIESNIGYRSNLLCEFANFYTSEQEQRSAVVSLESFSDDMWRVIYTDASSLSAKFCMRKSANEYLYLTCLTSDVTINGEVELYYTE